MSENQQHFCAGESFHQFQGVVDQKSGYNFMEFRVTSLRATQASDHKYSSSSKQISAVCRRDPRRGLVSPWAALGATQLCLGLLSHHREENAAMGLENSFHILYDNQRNLAIFKTAPDGRLVMYFRAKCRGKMPVLLHLSQQGERSF